MDGHALAIAWADDDGKTSGVANIPVAVPESFQFAFPWLNMQRQVEKSALKVLVKAKLPETDSYVLMLSGKADTVMLPLAARTMARIPRRRSSPCRPKGPSTISTACAFSMSAASNACLRSSGW